jgi:hypothetical protein
MKVSKMFAVLNICRARLGYLKIRRSPRWRDEAGFTLVEVLAALLILTAAVLPILAAFTFCSQVNLNAGRRIQALYYAAEVLEDVQANAAFQELPVGVYDAGNLFELGILESPQAGLDPEVIVAWDNQSLGLYRVTVNIQWQTQRSEDLELITLIYAQPN